MDERRRRAEATSRSPLLGNASSIVPSRTLFLFSVSILKMARYGNYLNFGLKLSELYE